MSIEQQLLADILTQPDQDGPRLIYADWLEEHGDPDRAEFIRIQLERAKLSYRTPCYAELERREEELLAVHRQRWAGKAARYVDDYAFWRGLVESVSVSLRKLNRYGDRLFAVAPVDTLTFTALNQNGMEGVAACRHLAHIRYLDLSGHRVGAGGARLLAASPHLSQLRILEMEGSALDAEGLRALLRAPFAEQLEALKIAQNYLATEGAEVLARYSTLTNLNALNLSYNNLTASGCEAQQSDSLRL